VIRFQFDVLYWNLSGNMENPTKSFENSVVKTPKKQNSIFLFFIVFFCPCTVHLDICKVHTPTNALYIKLDKVLKCILKITLTCSYMFRSTTIIREPSLEPSYCYI